MNNINFTAKNSFPLSTEVMGFLQDMVKLNANFAALGGANYILAGCVDDGSGNVSAGSIVINGEILPLEAGKKKTKITVQQKHKTLTAFGADYPEALISRTAKFSDTGEYNWGNFARVLTNSQIEEKINKISGVPVGSVLMWSGKIGDFSNEYMLCNGNFISKIDYPELYSVIGDMYGAGGNSFRIPDLQSRFIVGYSPNQTDYNNPGKTGGSETVTLSVAQIPSHAHRVKAEGASGNGEGDRHRITDWTSESQDIKSSESIGGNHAHENRPPYFVLAYIIKVK